MIDVTRHITLNSGVYHEFVIFVLTMHEKHIVQVIFTPIVGPSFSLAFVFDDDGVRLNGCICEYTLPMVSGVLENKLPSLTQRLLVHTLTHADFAAQYNKLFSTIEEHRRPPFLTS